MKSFIKHYKTNYEDELNIPLMNKEYDRPLVEYIVDAWKSLEVVPNIKFKGYKYDDKESNVDINKFILKRNKKKKKKERFDYKFIADDRCGKLTVYMEVTINEKDPETHEIKTHVYPITKSMLIPIQDEDGYFYIKGKKYYLIYQMLEKSTYTSANAVTLKSLMPVSVTREMIKCDEACIKKDVLAYDAGKKVYSLPTYYVRVFKKDIPVILFYLSRGIDYCLSFLGVSNVIHFADHVDEDEVNEENIYFQISNKCFMIINRELFEKYPFIQSVAASIIDVTTNRTTLDQLNDPHQWVKKISKLNKYDKGKDVLRHFNRLLDETTKKVIRINLYHLDNIYTVLRWMMQEFTVLRMKDNLSLDSKRLRCNEYIASLMTLEFSNRLSRIISLGDKATINNYIDLFHFAGDILIQKMHSSGVLRFDDTVNDMSFWSKFKYTTKGPHSLGGKNAKNINIKYRDLHPSYMSNIDCFVCGNSDPGTSGLLSPFAKIDGLYFNSDDEPNDFLYRLNKDIERISLKDGIKYIKIDCESSNDYLNILQELAKYRNTNVGVYGTSRDNHFEIVLENETEIGDDKEKLKVR